MSEPSMRKPAADPSASAPNNHNVTLECGWGHLILAQTFDNPADVARAVMSERDGARNIAMYVRDPHVILAQSPQMLFLDPSHTFRLRLDRYDPDSLKLRGLTIRPIESMQDAESINRIYQARRMVPADPGFLWPHRKSPNIT